MAVLLVVHPPVPRVDPFGSIAEPVAALRHRVHARACDKERTCGKFMFTAWSELCMADKMNWLIR